ncbi:MAG: hypothetical protein BWY86_00962 [Candidatus Aminicenantes bacterium ADurb.Bin508]|nr:MAG: hypothetical protein BWY86_00962 [Candidatus Aminicenantes bacterium ADurb.Bin508]
MASVEEEVVKRAEEAVPVRKLRGVAEERAAPFEKGEREENPRSLLRLNRE